MRRERGYLTHARRDRLAAVAILLVLHGYADHVVRRRLGLSVKAAKVIVGGARRALDARWKRVKNEWRDLGPSMLRKRRLQQYDGPPAPIRERGRAVVLGRPCPPISLPNR